VSSEISFLVFLIAQPPSPVHICFLPLQLPLMLLSVRQREILWVGPELNWPAMVRAKVASLDQNLVDTFVQNHISELKNMGKYEQLSKAQQ
jgi:hypothetical protein